MPCSSLPSKLRRRAATLSTRSSRLVEDTDEVRAQGQRQLRLPLEVEGVREEDLRKERGEVASTRSRVALVPRRESRGHPVRAGDDRNVLGQLDVESIDDRPERHSELLDRLYAEPLAPSAYRPRRRAMARSPAPSFRPMWVGRPTPFAARDRFPNPRACPSAACASMPAPRRRTATAPCRRPSRAPAPSAVPLPREARRRRFRRRRTEGSSTTSRPT